MTKTKLLNCTKTIFSFVYKISTVHLIIPIYSRNTSSVIRHSQVLSLGRVLSETRPKGTNLQTRLQTSQNIVSCDCRQLQLTVTSSCDVYDDSQNVLTGLPHTGSLLASDSAPCGSTLPLQPDPLRCHSFPLTSDPFLLVTFRLY